MEATSTIVIDDFAAFRDNDSGLNALLGRNWAIETLIPNADQSGGTWTPSTGSDKFDVVDDVPPNDSTYIQALDVGDIQLFDLPNLANLTAAKVVTLTGRLRDVGGTGNQPQFQIGNAGTATNAGSAITMAGSGFEDHFLLLATDPRDSGAWDVTKVNNLQAGVKVAS